VQTIGASFFLKQWGPYNVAIWVSLLLCISKVYHRRLFSCQHINIVFIKNLQLIVFATFSIKEDKEFSVRVYFVCFMR